MTIKNGNLANASEVVTGYGRLAAQNAYQTLQANDVFDNTDFLGADEFTDSNGTNNTVDTGNSTAYYDSDNYRYTLDITDEAGGDSTHDPDGFSNPSNAFDSDDGTSATKTGDTSANPFTLGKTFGSKNVGAVDYKVRMNIAGVSTTAKLQAYDGATWNDVLTIGDTNGDQTYSGRHYLESSTQGIRVEFSSGDNAGDDFYVYTLEYGDFDTPKTVETDEIISLNSAPDSIVVYADKTTPTDTSILVDVSSDGGTTWELTDNELNSYIDTTSLSGTSLALKFNLSTTDTSKTPTISGFGVAICDD